MYRGFNLEKIAFDDNSKSKFNRIGNLLYEDHKKTVRKTLTDYIERGALDGTKIQNDWFPNIDCNIFISHSHNDEENVIIIAGWLYDVFGLKTFVDSSIWGNANDLLKIIDNKYCYKNNGHYDYNKRNYSTSHVHMMLSTALTKMIDKTECLFFYNTPNSISSSDVINRTKSPWIYSEIITSELIRRNIPDRLNIEKIRKYSEGGIISEALDFEYELDLAHLSYLDFKILTEWQNSGTKNLNALDWLYIRTSKQNH